MALSLLHRRGGALRPSPPSLTRLGDLLLGSRRRYGGFREARALSTAELDPRGGPAAAFSLQSRIRQSSITTDHAEVASAIRGSRRTNDQAFGAKGGIRCVQRTRRSI